MEDGNTKKNNVDEKIRNINSFCNNILNSFEDSSGIKKKEANYKEYANQNEYEIISQTLTQKQEDELRKQLEHYKQSIM